MPPSTHSYESEQTENATKQDQSKEKSAVRVALEKYERKMKNIKIKARSGLSSVINSVQNFNVKIYLGMQY